VKSSAAAINAYLASLPVDRRKAIEELEAAVSAAMPKGYEEVMNWGMITWQVPLAVYRDTYNKKPLMYAALGNRKNHMALHLCGAYAIPDRMDALKEAFANAGSKLDMGADCVRFKTIGQLDIDAIVENIAAIPMHDFIAAVKAARGHSKR
jgi:uncharacterized protein YdhG (YjbR/CyaY superfamily)